MKKLIIYLSIAIFVMSCKKEHRININHQNIKYNIYYTNLPKTILHYNSKELYQLKPAKLTKVDVTSNLKHMITNIFSKNLNNPKLKKIELYQRPIRYKPTKIGKLYKANCEADWWKSNSTIFLITDESNKEIFNWLGWNKQYDCDIFLIDVDKNNDDEILIESDISGNQSTDVIIEMFDFLNKKFQSIISKTIAEWYIVPFSINNEMYFRRDNNNLIIKVMTKFEKDLLDTNSRNIIMKFRYSDNLNYTNFIEYTYNGTNYTNVTEEFDYREPFEQIDKKIINEANKN